MMLCRSWSVDIENCYSAWLYTNNLKLAFHHSSRNRLKFFWEVDCRPFSSPCICKHIAFTRQVVVFALFRLFFKPGFLYAYHITCYKALVCLQVLEMFSEWSCILRSNSQVVAWLVQGDIHCVQSCQLFECFFKWFDLIHRKLLENVQLFNGLDATQHDIHHGPLEPAVKVEDQAVWLLNSTTLKFMGSGDEAKSKGKIDCSAAGWSSSFVFRQAEGHLHLFYRCCTWILFLKAEVFPPVLPILNVIELHHDVLDFLLVVYKSHNCSQTSIDQSVTHIKIWNQHNFAANLQFQFILQCCTNDGSVV